MITTKWLQTRSLYWKRLEQMLERAAGNGIKRLTRAELRELGALYRQTAADLSALRVDGGSQQYAASLNSLLARAHNVLYSSTRPRATAVIEFYASTYPKIFRRNFGFFAAAFLLFAVAAIAFALVTSFHPEFQNYVLGPEMVDTIQRREMWTHSIVAVKPLASSGIMTNNLSVSFMAFAAGITAGVGTVYMMLTNGMLFGVISAACVTAGMGRQLFSFVAPHGVLELPAIFIAAGAGFRIAAALLFPHLMRRKTALRYAGQDAIRMMLGCIPLLILAGIVEGFVSPSGLPEAAKYAAGATLLAGLVMWLGLGWKADKGESEASNGIQILP
ncbi:MAG: stage II sporulation protein M [Acidobacteria bacterium]|nr:stage II sporulation protein M [Acidobacteriota bacterium]